MILKTVRQQRNYNYLELIKMYNSAIEKYGSDAKLSENEYKQISNQLSASLIGIDCVEKITDSIISEDEDSLNLFYKEGDKYLFEKENKILPTASKEEAQIIYSMLTKGDFDLFLDENQKNILSNNLKTYFENINEKPFNLYDFIEMKGESLCADSLSEIKEYFTLLNKAIDLKCLAKITYFYNDEIENHIIQPVGFVYSQLDLRMRVKAFTDNEKFQTFYISNIKTLELLESEKAFTSIEQEGRDTKELIFTFENIQGRAQRVAARFSDYKKEVHYNKNTNTLSYHIFYTDTPTENNRIIFRLRSLGKGITILSEEKENVKQEAQNALANYK